MSLSLASSMWFDCWKAGSVEICTAFLVKWVVQISLLTAIPKYQQCVSAVVLSVVATACLRAE